VNGSILSQSVTVTVNIITETQLVLAIRGLFTLINLHGLKKGATMTGAASQACFVDTPEDFCAVILASTVGARLFPLTSIQTPKHLLPMAGVPILLRLLRVIQASSFASCVVVIAPDDVATIPLLQEQANVTQLATQPHPVWNIAPPDADPNGTISSAMKLTVFRLTEDCSGSGEALRQVETAALVDRASHLVVLPADLVVLGLEETLPHLVHTHRQALLQATLEAERIEPACTILLADVGEQDEHGLPLKESAKQKKGGLAREEEEIEYVALSYESEKDNSPRVVWKQPKIDVEEDRDMTGATPKLVLPKPRLRQGCIARVRTDWSDLHVYVFAPWVRRLITSRTGLVSLQEDLLPLLISRQFQGVVETFGSKADKDILDEVLKLNTKTENTLTESNLLDSSTNTEIHRLSTPRQSETAAPEGKRYSVLARVVQSSALRAHSVASYLYASKEVSSRAVQDPTVANTDPCLFVPNGTSHKPKYQSVFLPDVQMGDKVTLKSCVVGRRCQIGTKCRLNNVVLMDDVVIGENTILQNSIVSRHSVIGENCNLNDCQVGPNQMIAPLTKEKGETFLEA
jgi:translation initiation factor eIF-2B subunit gamma